jgi:hypothetical protein
MALLIGVDYFPTMPRRSVFSLGVHVSHYRVSIAILAVGGLVLSSQPAHAYLDPGTGSMLLQLLLGGLAGAAVIGRTYWSRLKNLFGHTTASKDDQADGQRR